MIRARTGADGTPGGSLVVDSFRTWGVQAPSWVFRTPSSVVLNTPGDMTGDGKLNALDSAAGGSVRGGIQPFVTALLATPTDPAAVYLADFDSATGGSARGGNSGTVDLGDV